MKSNLISLLLLSFYLAFIFIGCQKLQTIQAREIQFGKDTTLILKYNNLAMYFLTCNIDSCVYYADLVSKLSDSINWEIGRIKYKNVLGSISVNVQDYSTAIKYFTDVSNRSEAIGYARGFYAAETNIGTIYLNKKDYETAIQYYHSALVKAKNNNDNENVNVILANLVQTFLEWSQTNTTLLDSALFYAQEYQRNISKYKLQRASGLEYYFFGQIYCELKDTVIAIDYFKQAENVLLKNNYILGAGYNNISRAKAFKTNEDSCIFYFKKALHQGNIVKSYDIISESSELLSEEYNSINVDSAYKYLKIYKIAQDSINKDNVSIALANEKIQRLELTKIEQEKEDRKWNDIKILGIIFVCSLLFVILLWIAKKYIRKKSKGFVVLIFTKYTPKFILSLITIIIFEAVSLMIHPYIEDITNHEIQYMLVIFAIIGVFIFPLHNKLDSLFSRKKLWRRKKAHKITKQNIDATPNSALN